ncbi:unnamed protein product [Urochloa decumbens]|uniref:F-box domain-containing protein n=1 Tax=Urochloa decumbens TaxID=240449 RepID=A0ABC8X5Y4_9POAL
MMGGSKRLRRRSRWADEATPQSACLPQEMVAEILGRLPVKPVLRFRSVCKAWRSTIDDPSFACAHLQHQPSSLLIFPCSEDDDYSSRSKRSNSISLYRWAQGMPAASLVQAADMPPEHYWNPDHHVLAHCDGLVLVHTGAKVHLLNPAARQAATLPWSPGSERPQANLPFRGGHQALGLGRDPRAGTYKVARFFYRLLYYHHDDASRYSYGLATGMEVLTLGGCGCGCWREIAAQPPFPAIPDRTATHVKGSLLWAPDERRGEAPGFLRLSLEDEALGVTPPPPCEPRLDYATTGLAELRGELCVARMAAARVLEMWMADDAVRPRWERRYAIRVADPLRPGRPRPVALLDHDATIVMHDVGWTAYAYHPATRGFQEIRLETIDYNRGDHPSGAIRCFSHFVLIPYRESLLPVVHKPSSLT